MKNNLPKAIVIGAGGGHLTEAILATKGVPIHKIYVTFWLPFSDQLLKGEKRHYVIDPHKSLIKYIINETCMGGWCLI